MAIEDWLTPTAEKKGSLKQSSARAAMWSGMSSVANQALAVLTTAVLARLLAPELFGLVSMSMIAVNLLSLIAELGLAEALIQRPCLEERHLSTTFWANAVLTLALGGLTIVIAPAFVAFFKEPLIQPMLSVFALSFFLGSFGDVHVALLQKNLHFRTCSLIEVAAQLAYGVAAVVMACFGLGVWALVFGFLVRGLVASALPWVACPWRPRLVFDSAAFKELFQFGMNLMGTRMILYVRDNIGNAIVGKALGAASLGFYNLAYNLTMVPGNRIAAMLGKVSLPAFAMIQDEEEKLRRGYLQSIRYIAVAIFPFSVGIIVTAPELVRVLYGPKWLPAIALVEILGLGGVLNSLPALSSGVMQAKGRPDWVLKITGLSYPVYMALILVGVQHGLVGMSWAITLNKLIFISLGAVYSCRVVNAPFRAYLGAISSGVVASLVMGAAVLAWRSLAAHFVTLHAVIILVTSVVWGIGVYFGVLRLLREDAVRELMVLIKGTFAPGLNLPVAGARTEVEGSEVSPPL